MCYHQLFERAYALCVKFNYPAIYDIAVMDKNGLIGVICLLSRLQDS